MQLIYGLERKNLGEVSNYIRYREVPNYTRY